MSSNEPARPERDPRASRNGDPDPVDRLAARRELDHLRRILSHDPEFGARQIVRARRERDVAVAACEASAGAVANMQATLEGLLEQSAALGRLQRLHEDGGPGPRALCSLGGQLQELPVHPGVSLGALRGLQPWDHVLVNTRENVVVGVARDADFHIRAQGAVVEFRGYHERPRGTVRIRRHGEEEAVVRLAEPLRDRELAPGTMLVLQRDDESLAIATADAERTGSRFEVPVEGIGTRLEDLAGLEGVIGIFVRDLWLGMVRDDLRERFGLDPLRGVTLYSYQPGMGKTALLRGLAAWLGEAGRQQGFDVALHVVKPNQLKSMWHGEDARLVREELCGPIFARQRAPRARPLYQLVVIDEADSLGQRAGGDDGQQRFSAAQNDVVQALLAELDGFEQHSSARGRVLWVALTNRPDMLDDALKRPGRFGDRIVEMPLPSPEMAEGVLAVHSRRAAPWFVDGELRDDLDEAEVRDRFLRPAVARVFDETVLHYSTDGRQDVPVNAGRILSNADWAACVQDARARAAERAASGVGIPALCSGDVLASVCDRAISCATQMAADRGMLARQLRLGVPVARAAPVPREQLAVHGFLAENGDEALVS